MSCIVALEHEGSVWMGGDSIAIDEKQDVCLIAAPKVFTLGELVIGCSGEFRQPQALIYTLELPPYNADSIDDERWMCTSFVDAVRKVLREAGVPETKEGRESISNFLVGYRGKVYQVESEYAVIHSTRGYDAIGCGAHYALGAMYTARSIAYPPDERVLLALQAAEGLNAGVRGPFTILRGGLRQP